MSPVTRIGFVGCPTQEGFSTIVEDGDEAEFIDLDNFHPQAERWSARLLPANVCTIIKRIVDNALSLELDAILFDEGYGKCDHARAAAAVCQEHLDIPIVYTRNDNLAGHGTPICDSRLPVIEKAERILDNLIKPEPFEGAKVVNPPVALWGVPASDFKLYTLFPDGTRLLGWFRCLENRTPADVALELEVDANIPTVFFAQTFCHKNILAKELARKYAGLYVDIDGAITASVIAKIETFLHFNVGSDR